MKKFIILDNVFTDHIRETILNFSYGNGTIVWKNAGTAEVHYLILDICKDYFDLSSMIGYELWRNLSPPGYHLDKDENLYKRTKQLKFPLCSIVYYPLVENLVGGEFCTEDNIKFIPISNRLLIFGPGLGHKVTPVESGKRIAISMAPWDILPEGYSNVA